MKKQNMIKIDLQAMERHARGMQISGVILSILSVTGFAVSFLLNLDWWPWRVIILVAALVFLVWALATQGSTSHLKELFYAVQEGEVTLDGIAKKVNRNCDEVRSDLRKMIQIGIFPDAVIYHDALVLEANVSSPIFTAPTENVNVNAPPAERINLNAATEQELANLPGISIALAKRAVELREQNGSFSSVHDFNQRVGLKPHHAVQIENLAFAESILPTVTPVENKKGRVLDI